MKLRQVGMKNIVNPEISTQCLFILCERKSCLREYFVKRSILLPYLNNDFTSFINSTINLAKLEIANEVFLAEVIRILAQTKSSVYGAREVAQYHHLKQAKLGPVSTSSTATKDHGQKLQRHGTRLSRGANNKLPMTYYKSPFHEELRARSLKAARHRLSEDGINTTLPLKALNGIFVVTMSFGTPSRDFTLLFDTGSDITWINCQSCSETCNNTQHPVFDPSSSSTFSKATCVDPPTGCDEYKTKYYDGSYSIGYFANDTLTLTPNDVLPGFLFGCAQNVDGDFAGADGVLGIGQGRRNLIAQSGTEYYSTFCYCLPAAEDSPGYFSLGIQAFDSCKPDAERVIPLEVNPNQDGFTNYYVRLTAISFGQLRFEIPFTQKTIIDTGTSISRLPASVYEEIRSAFRQLLAQYPLASPVNPMDTCYTIEGDISWTTPQVVLHFGSVEVNLDQSAVFSRESDSRLCLAFAESSDPTHPAIIGNQQHRELRVFYDIDDAKISFGSGGCSI
ncbi:hypothetical protein Tsubulata_048971 [Turnera subulata]|uniref:Peptidase A1 domain-containing protein n=1 Tax=Turnera subulata TaxID=218843 RepID=A0A9Q0JD89_9ROSI|nr:hypothetical protein Tsubulata_048971 [Turnera subulata]